MHIESKKNSFPLIVSACALLDQDGRVLITQRPKGKEFAGFWEFPGGKLETGETAEIALRRELREELAIEPCRQCFQQFAFTTFRKKEEYLLILLYLCRQWDGILKPMEAQRTSWEYPRELRSYKLLDADQFFVDELNDRLS